MAQALTGDGVAGLAARARFRVLVDGTDISPTLAPVLQRLTIRDADGAASDTCELEIDDAAGSILLPQEGVTLEALLCDLSGFAKVFRGVVDEVESMGGRAGGRLLGISAKGMDTLAPLKQRTWSHWDDGTVGDALADAAGKLGLTLAVDPDLGALQRPYIAQQGESFVAFGQRIAREVGGTFKLQGKQAALVKRGGGSSAGGQALETVTGTWGVNLIDWRIKTTIGRARHKRARVSHYDPDAASWREASADTADSDVDAEYVDPFAAGDADAAQAQADAHAGEVARQTGSGSATIEANAAARPEAVFVLQGARPGVDGSYRIKVVEHSLDRGVGVATRLELGEPHGGAGKDGRKAKPKGQVVQVG